MTSLCMPLLALCAAATDESDYVPQEDVELAGRRYKALGNAGAMTTDKLWPGGRVNYAIRESDLGLRNDDDRVRGAVAEWEAKTCIRFTKYESEDECPSPCMIFRDTVFGCSSMVGLWWTGRHTVTIGKQCHLGNVVHEIGHALGMTHEQNRNDRDEYVKIRWEWLLDGRSNNNFQTKGVDGRDIGPYSYDSIMHYNEWAAGTAYQKERTIVAPRPIGQRDGLAAGDVLSINFIYQNCQAAPTKPDCVASKATDTTHAVLQDDTFGVEFNGQFIHSAMSVSYERTTAPTAITTVSEPPGASIGDAGKTYVTFRPTAAEASQTYTLAATFTGPTGASVTCGVTVRVSEDRLTPAPPTPVPPTPVPPTPLPPVPEACEDTVVDGVEWVMGAYKAPSRYTCGYLAERPVERCPKYGETVWRDRATGLTGKEACCICGGGSTGSVGNPSTMTEPPSAAPATLPTAEPIPLTPSPSPAPVPMTRAPEVFATPAPTPEPISLTPSPSPAPVPMTRAPEVFATPAPTPEPISLTPSPSPAPVPMTRAPEVFATPAPTPEPISLTPSPSPAPVPMTPAPEVFATPAPGHTTEPTVAPMSPSTPASTQTTPAPEVPECVDERLPQGAMWYMRSWPRFDCGFMGQSRSYCEYYGKDTWRNEVTGTHAKEACCVCGGGVRGTSSVPTPAPPVPVMPSSEPVQATVSPTPTPVQNTAAPTLVPTPTPVQNTAEPTLVPTPTPAPTATGTPEPAGTCADRMLPSGGAWHMRDTPKYGCPFIARGSAHRCKYYSKPFWSNKEDGSSAMEACCACGGGTA